MPSLAQTISRFFQISALVVFVISGCFWVITPVLSSPLPVPSISIVSSNPSLAQRNVVADHHPRAAVVSHDVHYNVPRELGIRGGDPDTTSRLEEYHQKFSQHRDQMDALANSSARKRDIAPQDANDALDSFYIDLLGFRTLLKQLGADKGLLNYDPTNHMETLLKDDINLVKDTLTSVYKIVANIPVLGPLVYDIKCIVDEVLDAVENITDGILNSLPQLKDILNQIASLLGA